MIVFKIREIRNEKGLSLEELSEKSTINLGYLSQLERGEKQNPSIDTLIKVANALNENVKNLFFTIGDIQELKQKLYKSIKENGINHQLTVDISHLIDLLSLR